MDILTQIKKYRKENGITLEKAGELLAKFDNRPTNFSKQYIASIEGNGNIRMTVLIRYCRALGLEPMIYIEYPKC